MATYALIHGAGDVGWYWHLVERELRARGHETVAPDLPIEDDDATLADHARVVLDAIEALPDRDELVVVGQSWGGYIAPIVAERAGADRLILVAGMIPQPGETADEMWEATGWRMPREEDSSAVGVFYHDVDPASGRRSDVEGASPIGVDGRRAVAPPGLAGRPDPLHPVPKRPILPRRLAARRGARAPAASSPTRSTAGTRPP